MENPFLRSLFVQPRSVLGHKLLPFSAYHMAALMLVESPFGGKTEDKTITPEDLSLAVFICCHGIEDGPKLLFPELNVLAFSEYCDAVNYDFAEEVRVFEAHIADYLIVPKCWTAEGGGDDKQSGVPAPFHFVMTGLQNMNGVTWQQAWDMPINQLISCKVAIAETMGHDVFSDEDQALQDLKAQIEAQARQIEQLNSESEEDTPDA